MEKVLADNNVYHSKIPNLDEGIINRFWDKVALTEDYNLCWIWQAGCSERGYGRYHIIDRDFAAHRIAYVLHYKKDPLEFGVLHSCDNPRCVNPKHLFLGTNNDNVQDKVKKGRQARPTNKWKGKERPEIKKWNNPQNKLSESQWYEVKNIYEKGKLSYQKIADIYGISKRATMGIVKKMGGDSINRNILTEKQVLEIRSKYYEERGIIKRLSSEYKIGSKTISDIIYRKTWKYL